MQSLWLILDVRVRDTVRVRIRGRVRVRVGVRARVTVRIRVKVRGRVLEEIARYRSDYESFACLLWTSCLVIGEFLQMLINL